MKLFLFAQLLASFFVLASSLIHRLVISNDDRDIFKIETFGFIAGGMMNMTLSDFTMISPRRDKDGDTAPRIGFIMRKAPSESAAEQDLEKNIEQGHCILDNVAEDDFLLDLSDKNAWKETKTSHVVPLGSSGLYSLIFARCQPSGLHKVSFHLDVHFINPGPNYLSAGDAPLPILYLSFFVLFSITFGIWCWVLTRDSSTNGTVHRVHYMMAILLALKCLTLLFESIRYHYISIVGSSEGWSIVYYVFAFLKGVALFTVILLIGSGWSLMKAYLNTREKNIILIVLSLQVLDNIAMVVIEETAPGSQGWLTWRDVLHLVDIACCCAILFPIVWSIRHLQQAADADGKSRKNLQKLQLFRQFYIMVVSYIYFTRIVVYLLAATIPYYLLWLGALFTELATLLFFVVTGYKFRPAVDNPYIAVDSDENEGEEGGEYGLDDPEHDVGDPSRNTRQCRPSDASNTAGILHNGSNRVVAVGSLGVVGGASIELANTLPRN
jgi:G protein-coupled receptor 107